MMSVLDAPIEPTADVEEAEDDGAETVLSEGFARLVAITFGTLAALTAAFVVLASNRGMDVSDQALYLAMVDDPVAAIRSASAYHVLVQPIFQLVNESIVQLRLVRATLDIGADVVLGIALVRYLRARYPRSSIHGTMHGLATVALVVCGGFTMWVWAPNGFGYNEVGSILLTLLAAMLLLVLADSDHGARGIHRFALLFGLLFAGLMITRWTASIGFGVCAAGTLFSHHRVRTAFRLATTAALGTGLGLLSIHLFLLDLRTIVGGIAAGTTDVAQGAHAGDRILQVYFFSLTNGVQRSVAFLATVVGLAALAHYYRAGKLRRPLVLGLVPVLFAAGLLFERLSANRLGALNRWGTTLGLLCVLLLLARFRSTLATSGWRMALSEGTVAATLVATPIIAAVGSDNPIFVNAVLVSPVWIAAVLLLLRQFPVRSAISHVAGIGLLVLVASVPVLAYEGLLVSPNRIHGQQAIEVTEGRFAGLHVDETSHAFYADLEELRQELDPQPTVLSFWFRPAVLYGLDGRGIGFPWYTNFDLAASAATIEGACREDDATPTGQVVIVTQETDPANFGPVQDALRSCGIDFPNGFEQRQTLVAPGEVELTVFVRDAQ